MTQTKATTADFEWDVIEGGNTDFVVQYPRLQWLHGIPQGQGINKSGGLFMNAENYPNFEAKGFTEDTLILRDGKEIKGFGSAKANLAVIRIKHQWIKDEVYHRNIPLLQALVVVEGNDDTLCISLRGASKSLAFQKAFDSHLAQNVSMANRGRPQGVNPMEPFALWFPLISGPLSKITSKDGKSESAVTSPEMFQPETHDIDYVRSLWVGATNYKLFTGIYKETAPWQSAKIWAKRDDDDLDDDTPSHSGDGMLTSQSEMIAGFLEVKGIGEDELKGIILAATNGGSNNFRTLSRDEAVAVIDTLKAY